MPRTVDASKVLAAEQGVDPAPSDVSDVRIALGEALQRRAPEVGAAVVAAWRPRYSAIAVPYEELEEVITFTCRFGTELIGRYLATGQGATAAEAQMLAERSNSVATDQSAMTHSVRNYLTWRDQTMRVLREEARRLGASRALLAEASTVVRRSGDVSLINMTKEFDRQRAALQRSLEQERTKLTHLALHDPLTGLANRTLLLDRLAHALAGTARRTEQVGLLFLDLDGFKRINDTLGHSAGDRLLTAVAQRLVCLVRPADTVARLGGDEFVIVCSDLKGGDRALAAFTGRIQKGIATPFPDEQDLHVTVSIGGVVAMLGDDPEQVLARADARMYAAKQLRHG